MKALLGLCLIVASSCTFAVEHAAENHPASDSVTGEVLEVTDAGGYTYLRLKTPDGETWAAVGKAPVRQGDTVTIENVSVMSDFESKSLHRTFPTILFGNLQGTATNAAAYGVTTHHAESAGKVDAADIPVPKAEGENAFTIEEIMTQGEKLKDKTVLVRGRVVKYNPDIMNRNWVHLRDGTGSAENNTNDILVTTGDRTKIGDILTAKGVVRTNKDFGSGYSYKVLIEEATLSP